MVKEILFPVFLVLIFLWAGFLFWRKGKEEHYDEMELFDLFLIANLVGLVFGRIGFIIFNWDAFGLQVLDWFAISSRPGMSYFFWALGSIVMVNRLAAKKKWDRYEMLDFWSISLAAAQLGLALSLFALGVGLGDVTSLPWGMRSEGLFEPRHPVQLYSSIVATLLVVFLSWAESRYRTFSWYRRYKNSAQTGFLFAVFLLVVGFSQSVLSLTKPSQMMIGSFDLELIIYSLVGVLGLVVLITRAGLLKSRRRS